MPQGLANLVAGKQPELCIAAIHLIRDICPQFCNNFNVITHAQLRVTPLGQRRA